MAATAKTATLTIGPWAALPEDDEYELVDGKLAPAEMPSFVHEAVVLWLTRILAAWAEEHAARVYGSGGKFAVSASRGRQADISVFFEGTRRPPARGACTTPADLLVEVVSSSPADGRRDRVEKLLEYAQFGVRFYWLVDPEERTFEIFERSAAGRYELAVAALGGRVDAVPGLVGCTLDIDALFRDVDAVIAESGGG